MKQKIQQKKHKRGYLTRLAIVSVVIVLTLGMFSYLSTGRSDAASISELQQQSQQLQAAIKENEKKAAEFRATAHTLEGKIKELNTEIAVAAQQIELLSVQIKELQLKIEENNRELDRQRGVLGANIRMMYFEGDVSTIEMLASSQDLSEFVDREQYRNTVQDKVKTAVDKIKVLKAELQAKQEEIQKLLDQQQAQRKTLDDKRQEQQSLLDATRGEESRYRQRIRDLTDQQRAVNRELARLTRSVGSGTGGYPWSNAICVATGQLNGDCWDYEWYANGNRNDRQDPWGYYYRNCTSYVAWRSASLGLDVSGLGNATTWDNRAGTLGLKTGSSPKVGAFAVWEGSYGHVAFVEAVANGEVLVSEYNFVQDGVYSERWIPLSNAFAAPDTYVYTPWAE